MMRKWRIWETNWVLLKRSFFLRSPDEIHDEEMEGLGNKPGAAEEKFLPPFPERNQQ
jgi:hypothetical protein